MIENFYNTKWYISLMITCYIFSALYCYKVGFTWEIFITMGIVIFVVFAIAVVITESIYNFISKKKL